MASRTPCLIQRFAAEAVAACDDVAAHGTMDQFPIDQFRSAGTSVNMNANEVIANRAVGDAWAPH